MACPHGAEPAPRVEGLDPLLALEPVIADDVKPFRQIKIMSRLAAVFVHIGPIIGDQSIERAPQRQITAIQHPGILPRSLRRVLSSILSVVYRSRRASL